MCVFLDAPVGDSTVALRWRRLARYVADLGDTTAVVTLSLPPDSEPVLEAELDAGVVALDAPRNGRWRGLWRALLRPWRSWPPTRTDVAVARRRLEQVIDGTDPDLVWCAGADAFLAVPKRLRSRAVVDYIDLPSRNRRELARVALHRIGRRITHEGGVDASVFGLVREVQGGVSSRLVERYVGRRAAAVTVASPTEARAGVHCVRTGVDDPGLVAAADDEFPVPHFVFPGSFLYPPHQDAAEWFALYVLPPLRDLLPASRVIFAGECPDWMHAFGELHGIEVTGRLEDLGTVLDARSVVIAPIRAGSGTIVEVIEAWARGVPVVATSRAVEGLQPTDGVDVLVADDPAEFAARCSMAARYPEVRAALAGNGRARYEAEFTWPGIGADLVAWLAALPALR
jgi:glycosyltransferase involved in cell wall biosynthesis